MRRSWAVAQAAWRALFARGHVVLMCYCPDAEHCHRTILRTQILPAVARFLGTELIDEGELAPMAPPPAEPGEKGRPAKIDCWAGWAEGAGKKAGCKRAAVASCGFYLAGHAGGRACGAPLCTQHAKAQPGGALYCPAHDAEATGPAEAPPAPEASAPVEAAQEVPAKEQAAAPAQLVSVPRPDGAHLVVGDTSQGGCVPFAVVEDGKRVGGGIVCLGRGGRRRCKGRPGCTEWARFQCDHPLQGAKAGKTCDVYLCPSCAKQMGINHHLCPAHARLAPAQERLL